ncbi:MAG TPA: phosphotransferase [Methylibium sp.]|nr:phosphotransferase [Methylibium sp.]
MNPAPTIAWTDPLRQAAFERWLAGVPSTLGLDATSLRPASSDASFRRYFRIDGAAGSRIVMDAPPQHEDCAPFVRIAGLLHAGGLRVPEVLDWDRDHGFLLLDDLGSTTYLAALEGPPRLDAAQAHGLYLDALEALVRLQRIDAQALVPAYDRALLQREIDLFPEWYVARHCGTTLSDTEREQLARCSALILDVCCAQPAVLVHRDYHSRNLMLGGVSGGPGVLDFQDAVWGPITYDLASLLRDAYIEWDEEVQIDWAIRWWERARKAGLPVPGDFGTCWRDFEWMGLQRHLKVLGIFARLHHRDGKDGYLKDLPLVWRYAHRTAARYSVLKPLARLLERLGGTERRDGYTF